MKEFIYLFDIDTGALNTLEQICDNPPAQYPPFWTCCFGTLQNKIEPRFYLQHSDNFTLDTSELSNVEFFNSMQELQSKYPMFALFCNPIDSNQF